MRHTSSGCRWSSTDWLRWNGGSNQNQRSAGKPACMRTSAIRKRSRNVWPLALLPEHAADRRARAVARDEIAACERVVPVGGFDVEPDAIAVLLDRDDLVLPAHLEVVELGGTLAEIAFEVVLLQVDERGTLVPGLRQQVERVDELVLEVHLADVPRYALGDRAVAAPQPIEDLQRSLGEADRTRAGRQRVVVVEQQRRDALLREIDRRGQADRTGADDDHRMVHRLRRRLIGRSHIVEGDAAIVHRSNQAARRR